MKEKILDLRKQGKSYNEIQKLLNCSKGTIAYHCGDGQKTKNYNRQIKRRAKNHPYQHKIETFIYREPTIIKPKNILKVRKQLTDKVIDFQKRGKNMSEKFTVEDILNKFGENPKCYLTGLSIDINKPSTYHFDHIIPVSRGGDNSLNNLGICTKQANIMKSDMTPDELINLCKLILNNKATAEGIEPQSTAIHRDRFQGGL